MTKIRIIDAMCGAGKTSYAIQTMNDKIKFGFGNQGYFDSEEKFLYVTPYLEEVERIINATRARFAEPDAKCGRGSKLDHVRQLVEYGESIVMTHKLFSMIDKELITDIESQGYTLIMDEVANVLEYMKISSKDIKKMIDSNTIKIESDGKVIWIDEDYADDTNLMWSDVKRIAERGGMYIDNEDAAFWTLPVELFTSFKEVYILTYLFDGQIQKYYYDVNEIEYEKYSIKQFGTRYNIIPYDITTEDRITIKNLLKIYQDDPQTLNTGGRRSEMNTNYLKVMKSRSDKAIYYSLSTSWFEKTENSKALDQLRKNVNSFLAKENRALSDCFWTTVSSAAPKIKGVKAKFNTKGIREKDNFVSLNIRATNKYRDRSACVYAYNRFMNPIERRYFSIRGHQVNESMLAVSDLIQFLFRGCIRDGEEMIIYIPSERMRNLLINWLNYKI